MEGAISLNISLRHVAFHGFRLLVQASVCHRVYVIQVGGKEVKVSVLREGAFVLSWASPLLLRALSPLVFSSFFILILAAIGCPKSIFLLANTPSTLRRASLESSSFMFLLAFL